MRTADPRESFREKLTRLGFPLPEEDPQLITRSGSRALTFYYPPPRDLGWLAYTGENLGRLGVQVVVASRALSTETERDRLDQEAREMFPQAGTILFGGDTSEIQKKLNMKGMYALAMANEGSPELPTLIERAVEYQSGGDASSPGIRRSAPPSLAPR